MIREDVISDLAILRTWCAVNPDYGVGLSVEDCRKAVAWLDDTLELLKAHEPRVLDFGEIQTMSNADVFFEERSSSLVYPLMLMGVENSNKSQKAFFIPMTAKPLRTYGKTWRCWTSRPTDEQREATPWE